MTSTTIIQCSREDLRAIVAEEVEKGISNALAAVNSAGREDENTEYLSRAQVCEMLHISKPTFHDWVNCGMLVTVKVGSRTLVSREDLQRRIESGQIKRYKHGSRKK